jgi:hypothetical protein
MPAKLADGLGLRGILLTKNILIFLVKYAPVIVVPPLQLGLSKLD